MVTSRIRFSIFKYLKIFSKPTSTSWPWSTLLLRSSHALCYKINNKKKNTKKSIKLRFHLHSHRPLSPSTHLTLAPPPTVPSSRTANGRGQPNNRRAESTPLPSRHRPTVLPLSQANGLWRVVAATAASTQHQLARHTDMYVDLESRGGGGVGFSCVQKKRRVISESILQSPRRHQIPAADASPAWRLCARSP